MSSKLSVVFNILLFFGLALVSNPKDNWWIWLVVITWAAGFLFRCVQFWRFRPPYIAGTHIHDLDNWLYATIATVPRIVATLYPTMLMAGVAGIIIGYLHFHSFSGVVVMGLVATVLSAVLALVVDEVVPYNFILILRKRVLLQLRKRQAL